MCPKLSDRWTSPTTSCTNALVAELVIVQGNIWASPLDGATIDELGSLGVLSCYVVNTFVVSVFFLPLCCLRETQESLLRSQTLVELSQNPEYCRE